MDQDKISIGDAEKSSLKKVLPWLILKVNQNQAENPQTRMMP